MPISKSEPSTPLWLLVVARAEEARMRDAAALDTDLTEDVAVLDVEICTDAPDGDLGALIALLFAVRTPRTPEFERVEELPNPAKVVLPADRETSRGAEKTTPL